MTTAVLRELCRQAAVVGLVCGLSACAHDRHADDPEDKPGTPRLVGRVASLPADGGFVLIQSYGTWSVPDGEPVFSQGPGGRAANLLPTGERLSQFVAADIRSGQVSVGDGVYTSGTKPKAANPTAKPDEKPLAPAKPTETARPPTPSAGRSEPGNSTGSLPPLPEE